MSAAIGEAPNPSFTAALVTTMRLRPGVEASFSSWHARMSTAPVNVAGLRIAEVNAPAPVASLTANWEGLVSFFDSPVEHWKHLRTTNMIESAFATVPCASARPREPARGARGC